MTQENNALSPGLEQTSGDRTSRDRMIPRAWFSASAHSFSMATVLHVDGALGREGPLFPGERRLGWFILPDFQRPPVWTQAQKVRFIESAWSGLPLGAWIYNRTPRMTGKWDGVLLDGQQRITAVLEYAADAFPVFGHLYSELTVVDRRQFNFIGFPALETHLDDEAQLREVYDRLAYGGTPHEPKPHDLPPRLSPETPA